MTYTNCHPLKSVCLFLNAVAYHLDKHEFISNTLTKELLPPTTQIIYKSEASDKTRNDALPMVAYAVAQLGITPFKPASVVQGTPDGTAGILTCTIKFTVSTTNEALTSELAFEIAQLCMALHKTMQTYNFFIQGIGVDAVRRTQGNFFEATTTVQANCGYPVWQHTDSDDIVREIGMSLNII